MRDLSEAFNISLSPNCLFELETLADLVAHVMSEMGADAVASSETLPTSDVSRGAILSQAASARIHVPAVDATAVMATLREVATKYLTKPDTVLDDASELESLGLDSIDGMEFVRDLSEAFDISLSPNIMFEMETLADLTAHVMSDVCSKLTQNVEVQQELPRQQPALLSPVQNRRNEDVDHDRSMMAMKMERRISFRSDPCCGLYQFGFSLLSGSVLFAYMILPACAIVLVVEHLFSLYDGPALIAAYVAVPMIILAWNVSLLFSGSLLRWVVVGRELEGQRVNGVVYGLTSNIGSVNNTG